MVNRFSPIRTILSLVGALSLLVVSMVAIPSTFLASPAQAATVSSGTCTAEVNDATGVSMSVAANGDCVLTFATASSTPTGSSDHTGYWFWVPFANTTAPAPQESSSVNSPSGVSLHFAHGQEHFGTDAGKCGASAAAANWFGSNQNTKAIARGTTHVEDS